MLVCQRRSVFQYNVRSETAAEAAPAHVTFASAVQVNPRFMVFDCKVSRFLRSASQLGEIVKTTVASEYRTFFSVRCR
jgi:hypothetical protein